MTTEVTHKGSGINTFLTFEVWVTECWSHCQKHKSLKEIDLGKR